MKKVLFILFILLWGNVMSQTILFEDSFESYDEFATANVGNWTLVDVDQQPTYGIVGVSFPNTFSAKSFQVFNSTTTTPPMSVSSTSDWSARTGLKNMVCFSATKPTSAPLNNDWLISPQIVLSATGNVLSFWAKSCNAVYGLERFKVGVSTTDTNLTSFMVISDPPYVITTDDVTWNQYSYNLDAYANTPVYVSINCVSNDQFGFAVDDFKVTASILSTDSFFKNNFTALPNPTKGELNLVSAAVGMSEINLMDSSGRLVKSISLNESMISKIDLNDVNSGVYMLKVSTSQGIGISRIIKD